MAALTKMDQECWEGGAGRQGVQVTGERGGVRIQSFNSWLVTRDRREPR